MSPAAAFHAQLASIMEVLANTAVAEICELVDGGYAVLQLEISRSRKENETLRRKLRLMELRAARASALRAMATANGSTLLLAGGRARASLAAHHPGNEPRRSRTPGGEVSLSRVSPQETLRCRNIQPSSDSRQETTQQAQPAACESAKLTTAVIKVEDDDESWSQPEQEKDFCHVIQGQQTETEAAPLLTKQEVIEDGGTSLSWTDGDISSNTSKMPDSSDPAGYDCVIYEPQVQHGPCSTQNPLREDPGCSYILNTSESVSDASDLGGNFSFAVSEVTLSVAEHQQPAGFQDSQQRAPLPADEPQLPVRKEMQHAYVRRDGWRRQDSISREDSSGKAFVCNCCGKTLACLKNLKTHMRVHTGEKPFVCALCGKRFSDSSNLKRHQSVHTGEKRYGCVHCGKRFAQSGSLKVHMTVHTDCKQFRCSYCGKTFISGSHLRRHITVHAGEKRFTPTSQ